MVKLPKRTEYKSESRGLALKISTRSREDEPRLNLEIKRDIIGICRLIASRDGQYLWPHEERAVLKNKTGKVIKVHAKIRSNHITYKAKIIVTGVGRKEWEFYHEFNEGYMKSHCPGYRSPLSPRSRDEEGLV